MSKLLSRAVVALENAEHNYKMVGQDDCFMDACCYNLQQSIEFSLKFLVEMTGQQYAENHDIRANINLLNCVDYHILYERRFEPWPLPCIVGRRKPDTEIALWQ